MKVSAETEKGVREPNKEQKECIENNLDKYLVIAGPGTGKTFTISRKIQYLIENEHILPEKILCLTFTEAAAREMRERAGGEYPVNVFTFHGFCLDIIQRFQNEFGLENINPINGSNERTLINECIDELHSDKNFVGYNNIRNNPYEFAKEISDGIDEIKKNRMKKETFFKNLETNPLWMPRLNEIPNIITQKKLLISQKEKELADLENQYAELSKKGDFRKLYITPLKNEIKKIKKEVEDTLPKQAEYLEQSIAKMKELWGLYELYEQKKKAAGYIDFTDMINCVLDKFEDKNSDILREVSNMYDFVLVDEYQDTNTAQNEIVFHLGENCENLFVVGDDDQIIFSFQGAHLDTIENLIKKFDLKKENINCLKDNHRSTEAILKAAETIAGLQDDFACFKVEKRHDNSYDGKNIPLRLCSNPDFRELGINKKLEPKNEKLYPLNKSVEYIQYDTKNNEINSIVDRITEIIDVNNSKYKTPGKLSEIAILTRNNEELYEYETYLKAKGICVEFAKGKNIFSINSVITLITYMQFLISPSEYSDKMFAYLLMKPFHINPEDFFVLKQKCRNNSFSLIENMKNLLKESLPNDKLKKQIYAVLKTDSNSFIEDIKQILDKTEETKSDIFKEPDKIEKFIKTYEYLRNFIVSENYKNSILEIGSKTGIFDYYFSNEINRAENIKGINQLINEADSFFSVHKDKERSFSHFVEYITNIMISDSQITTEQDDKPVNAVQLSTYHSSKGREFEYVFMPNLHRGKWEDSDISKNNLIPEKIPSSSNENETFESMKEKIEEKKFLDDIKLLYVGVTRAKHGLYLSCSKKTVNPAWYIKNAVQKMQDIKLSNGEYALSSKLVEDFPEYIPSLCNYNYKEFEKTTLPKKHSPSSLNVYMKCPMQYFYRYILKLNNDISEAGSNDNPNFGTAMHETFRKVLEYAQTNNKYPEISEVLLIFEEEMTKLTFEHFENQKNRGIKLFNNYYEKFKSLADPATTVFELEQGHTFKITDDELGEIEFYGKTDRTDTDSNGKCIVYDYKSGDNNKEIEPKGTHQDYYYQMGLYKYLLQKHGKKVDRVCFIYPEINDEASENEIYVDALTDEECEKIAKDFIDIVKKINNFEFDKPQKPDCSFCYYVQWCQEQKIFD